MSAWKRFDVLTTLEKVGLVPTVWAPSVDDYLEIGNALLAGGLPVMEILQRAGADDIPRIHSDAVYEIRRRFGTELLVGAGTVQTRERAQAVIDCGAQFVVSNLTDEGVIETANLNGTVVIPAAETHSEVRKAMRLGCHVVKLFINMPSLNDYANLRYLGQFRDCFPRTKFMVTAGVSEDNLDNYLQLFPFVVPSLVSSDMVTRKNWLPITNRAKHYVDLVRQIRAKNPIE